MSYSLRYVDNTSGLDLYAVLNPRGFSTFLNGPTPEAYNASHWTDYAIDVDEVGATKQYYGTLPAGLSSGWYTVATYQQIGASPDPNDPVRGQGSLYISTDAAPAPASIVPAFVFVVPTADVANPNPAPGTGRPDETVGLAFDFGNLPQIGGGAEVATISLSSSPAGLTISDEEYTGHRVLFTSTGGVVNTDYSITAAVTLSDGTALNPTGVWRVR